MRLAVEFMQLHEPLFLAGVNLGLKLYPKSGKGDLGLTYDTEMHLGIVTYKGKVAIIQNIASATIVHPEALGIKIGELNNTTTSAGGFGQASPNIPLIAQVSDPTKQIQGKKLRPAKYQGGEETQGE